MKAKMSETFSFPVTDSEHFKDTQDTIELVSCPLKEMMCKFHLSAVNKSFLESELYRREKDYHRSIETLKSAFNITTELMEHPCTKCAQLFRSTIIESLENIHGELEKMSKGIFGNKRYQSSYIKVDNLLKEFENVEQRDKVQLNESKEQFLGNHLN
jgi:hypothetical protein